MAEGDELPDWDYQSIYGTEAMWRRLLARTQALEQAYAAQQARLRQLMDAMEARTRASDPP